MDERGPYFQKVVVNYNTTNTKYWGFHPQTNKDYYFVQYRTPSDALADNDREKPSWIDALESRTRQAHPDAYCIWSGGTVGYLVTDTSIVPDYSSEYDVVTRSQSAAAAAPPVSTIEKQPMRYFDPLDDGRPWYAIVRVGYMTDGYPRIRGDPWASFDYYLVQYNSRMAGLEDNRQTTPSWAAALVQASRAKHRNGTEFWPAGKESYLRQNLFQGESVDFVSPVVYYEL